MSEQDLVQITQSYYDSSDADNFYHTIWGGEDIHVGIYEPGDDIPKASHRTVVQMAEKLQPLTAELHLLDVGAGYGGAARYLARKYGCKVTCLNLSEVENERNRLKSKEQGLDQLVDVVGGNFEALPFEDDSFDHIWSEDAFLHSGEKPKVIEECYRVLKPGGKLVFTDPMQADECPEGVLAPVLERIHLREMGSVAKYRDLAKQNGFSEFEAWEMPEQLVNHYGSVREQLIAHYDKLLKNGVSQAYLDRMKNGLSEWVKAGNNGYLNWGIILMTK